MVNGYLIIRACVCKDHKDVLGTCPSTAVQWYYMILMIHVWHRAIQFPQIPWIPMIHHCSDPRCPQSFQQCMRTLCGSEVSHNEPRISGKWNLMADLHEPSSFEMLQVYDSIPGRCFLITFTIGSLIQFHCTQITVFIQRKKWVLPTVVLAIQNQFHKRASKLGSAWLPNFGSVTRCMSPLVTGWGDRSLRSLAEPPTVWFR